MRLLILSFYYPPDLGAGSFRVGALIRALEQYKTKGLQIDVLTTQPNRYSNFKTKVSHLEDKGWLRIHRINTSTHDSGMLGQSLAFLQYAMQVKRITKTGQWDMVFSTSSRLMTAALGAHIARQKNIALYLDIRDIFTDTISDIFAKRAWRPFLKIFEWIERLSFKNATQINVVSAGFLDHMRQVVPGHNCSVYTNGIDEIFLNSVNEKEIEHKSEKIILYAGNIGEGQGLHHILPSAAKALCGTVRFRIIGNGGRFSELKSAIKAQKISNIELLSPLHRNQLLEEYKRADILFLHLNNHPAFEKVIPSKLFEYGATGKPILAGVSGYPAQFIKTELPFATTFPPCDAMAMIRAIATILNEEKKINNYEFCMRYDRVKIMNQMANEIMEVLYKATARNSANQLML